MNYTIVFVYVADLTDRTSIPELGTSIVPDDLDPVLGSAFSDLGIDRTVLAVGVRGDRILILAPSSVSKALVADLLPSRLTAVLRQRRPEDATAAVRRLFIHNEAAHGEATSVDFASRVLDAAEAGLASWQSANVLDVIVSDDFYRTVIVQESLVERAAYQSISIDHDVAEIWVRQPDVADELLSWLDELSAENIAVQEFLRGSAFLAAQPIPLEWFDSGSLGAELLDLFQVLGDGTGRGWVTVDRENNTVQVHRLLRLALRDRMTPEQRLDARRSVHRLLASLDPGDPTRKENWPRYRVLFPNAEASALVESDDKMCRALTINLMRYLYVHGEQLRAVELAEEAWNAWGKDDEADPQSLEVASYRGLFLWALGRFKEAAKVNSRALSVRREVSGEDSKETVLAKLRVAVDARVDGDFRAVRDQNRAIHEQTTRLFEANDPIRLQTAHDLAVITRLCGDYRAALDLDRSTWSSRAEVLGADNSDTLVSRSGLLIDQRELGEYPVALAGHREVAGQLLELVGEGAPGTLLRQAYLAVALRKAGDYPGALELSGRTHERLARVYGATHPFALACAVGYASDLRNGGRIDEALRVGAQARSGYHDVLGESHPFSLAAAANAAVTVRLNGDPAAARELNQQTSRGFEQSLTADHPHAVACAINLASDLAALGDLDAAIRAGGSAHERAESVLGPDHPTTLAAGLNLVLDESARGGDAESRYTEIKDRYRRALGAEHPATVAAEAGIRANCDIDPLPM
jgi:tetratricopeptide (TPR) repeat protein